MGLEDELERGPWSAAKQKHNCVQQAGYDSHSPQYFAQHVDARPCAYGQSVWAHLLGLRAVVVGYQSEPLMRWTVRRQMAQQVSVAGQPRWHDRPEVHAAPPQWVENAVFLSQCGTY